MAAKKPASRARKPTRAKKGGAKSGAARQLAQLRATANKLRTRLMAEARRRRIDLRLLAEARRARLKVTKQISALRDQGLKLASQLNRTARDARAREEARQAALAKVAELREELRRKRDEVRRTAAELAKLARESAERARAIVESSGVAPAPMPPPSHDDSNPPAVEPPPIEKPPI